MVIIHFALNLASLLLAGNMKFKHLYHNTTEVLLVDRDDAAAVATHKKLKNVLHGSQLPTTLQAKQSPRKS